MQKIATEGMCNLDEVRYNEIAVKANLVSEQVFSVPNNNTCFKNIG